MEERELLLKRLLEAAEIAGSLANLCRKAGINYVQVSRVKSYLMGTSSPEQRRQTFSVKNMKKLAEAIGEDISFFTDENYKRKNVVDIVAPEIRDDKLTSIINKLRACWAEASEDEKGFLAVRFEQVFKEHKDIIAIRAAERLKRNITA